MRAKVRQARFREAVAFVAPVATHYAEGAHAFRHWICFHTGPVLQFVNTQDDRLVSVPMSMVQFVEYADGVGALDTSGAKGKASRKGS